MSPETVLQFDSVEISHDIVHRIDFCYLAEFFRFIGIFVCEDIFIERREKTEIERKTNYSAQICVGHKEVSAEQAQTWHMSADEYGKIVENMPNRTIFLYNLQTFKNLEENDKQPVLLFHQPVDLQKAALKELMGEVLGCVLGSHEDGIKAAAEIGLLVDIYAERRLCFHSMNLQYYHKKPSDAVEEAEQVFLSAHEDVKKALDEIAEDHGRYLYHYALLWCEVKMNDACSYNGDILYFIQEKIARRCRELCERYPKFCNAKVLLGLSYEPSVNSVNQALQAFQSALPDIHSKSYAANVYYFTGKRYELFWRMKDRAEQCYLLAEQCKPKFRPLFKRAILAKDKKEFDYAIKLFEEIINRLRLKMEQKYADPLEMEYLFKSYTQESYIYYKTERYMEAIQAGQRAIRTLEDFVKENRYFNDFYAGSDAEHFRNLTKSRMDLRAVDQLLAKSYREISDEENAKFYRERVLAEQSFKQMIYAGDLEYGENEDIRSVAGVY